MTAAAFVALSFADPAAAGYSGLDRHGRVIDLHYKNSAGATLHRYQHGYDLSGNRLHARTTLWNSGGAPFDNTRSHLYGYDALQRLIRADFGMLDAENDALASSGGPTPYTHQWKLDILGNWRGTAIVPGLKQTYDFDGDSYPDDRTTWHVVDKANRIRRVTEVVPDSLPSGGGPDPFGPPEVITTPPEHTPDVAAAPVAYLFYDRAGNLVTDGAYWYQYDAWNRLIQVNLLGTATFDAATGRINGGAAGTWLRRYVYDGLGRLAARLSPSIANPAKDDRYDYYYDGVRRIQEDLKLGAGSTGGGGGGGGLSGQLEELHEPTLPPTIADANSDGTPDFPDANTDGTPDAPPGTTHNITSQGLDENTNGTPDHQEIDANTNGTLDDAEFGDANSDGTPDYPDADTNGTPDFGVSIFAGPAAITERQYLWGADYVDECIAQITCTGLLFFVMQDANYNVVALVPASGAGAGQVAVQYSWSPYGELLAIDHFAPVPDNRLGHQGLFVDRLDGTSLTLSLQPNTPELYYNRNRTYHPGLGRFLQKDPNATGMLSLADGDFNAGQITPALGSLSKDLQFQDGALLYQALGSNPVNHRDAFGLSTGESIDYFLLWAAGDPVGIIGGLKPIFSLIEERNLELERFCEMAADGEIDAALEEFETAQQDRWVKLRNMWGLVAEQMYVDLISRVNDGINAVTRASYPIDFFTGDRNYVVYIGYDKETGKATYVGRTRQALKARESQHGTYDCKEHLGKLTDKQSRAVEQVIIDDNPHFNNKRNSISERHKWRSTVTEWARKALRAAKKGSRFGGGKR